MSPTDEPVTPVRSRTSRRTLRRSAQSLVRLGTVLGALSLVALLLSGWLTQRMISHVSDNAVLLRDGTATVQLERGDVRGVYVSGGAIAPGEDLPTPVEDISCTVTGPGGAQVPFGSLADDGRAVGVDTPLARFQVVGDFRAEADGGHQVVCTGAGVSVAPQVSPASVLGRVGALALSSLGTFAGLGMLVIGGLLMLVVRYGAGADDVFVDDEQPDDDRRLDDGDGDWWDGDALDDEADDDAGPTPGDDETAGPRRPRD